MRLGKILVMGAGMSLVAMGCDGDTTTPDASTDTTADVAADAGADATVETTTEPDTTPDPGPADDGTPDVTPEPDAEPDHGQPDVPVVGKTLVCGDYATCIFSECAADDDPAACAPGATTACAEGGEQEGTQEAQAAAGGLFTCLLDNQCELEPSANHYQCFALNCLTEMTTCSTPMPGTNPDCDEIYGCTDDCYDIFGDRDWACVEGCTVEYTALAIEQFWARELCIEQYCWDKDMFDKPACVTNALSNSAVCGIPNSNCGKNTGE